MKLLIEIPETVYEHAKESSEDSRDEFDAMRAIANGTQINDDYISLQAVDDAIYEYSRSCDLNYSQIMEYIEKISSVSPQQKMGMWIEHFDEIGKWYECDQCHTDWGGPVNFCPNCGAKMEVE